MITLGRSWTGLFVLTVLVAGSPAHAACPDTEAPTITVSDITSECNGVTTFAFIDPDILDDCDPLPQLTFDNAFNDVDPDAFPIGQHFVTVTGEDAAGRTRDELVSVTIEDTTAPAVTVGVDVVEECTDPAGTPVTLCNGSLCRRSCSGNGDCPGTGTCDGDGRCTCGGDGDCPIGSSCVAARCSAPFATDVCTATSSLVVYDDGSGVYAVGSTPVNITAVDIFGNTGTGVINVVVSDTVAPTIADVYDFGVEEKADCVVATGLDVPAGTGDGTRVLLQVPSATDACSLAGEVDISNSVGGLINSVCLADSTAHPVTWTALDGSGNVATVIQTVLVGPPSGAVSLDVLDTPNGWENTADASVQCTATGATPDIDWTAVGAHSETATTSVNTHTFYSSSTQEGEYCPLYLSFVDAAANVGVSESVCFGFDRGMPTQNFGGLPTDEWVDAVDPSQTAAIDGGDPTTYPVFSHGELLDLRFVASDPVTTAHPIAAGISNVEVLIDSAVVYDASLTGDDCPHPGGTVTTLPTCAKTLVVDGCNNPTNAHCEADGRITLRDLTSGGPIIPEAHVVSIRVTDLAGNIDVTDHYIRVGNLSDVLLAEIDWIDGLTALPTPPAPLASASFLFEARDLLGTANKVLEDSPGHAFLLARSAYLKLEFARAAGAPGVKVMQERLSRAIVGEARRLLETTAAQTQTDWAILEQPVSFPGGIGASVTELYTSRTFLVPTGLYQVQVAPTLNLAAGILADAQQDLDDSPTDDTKFFSAIDLAIDTYDASVMLFTDDIMADLYGLTVREVSIAPGLPERYYRGSAPGRFGDTLGKTVAQQIERFAAGADAGQFPGIPAEAVTTLVEVSDLIAKDDTAQIESFVDAVAALEAAAGDGSFDNEDATRLIYMNAVQALEKLRTVQGSSVYTHYWQAGISATVAFVMNFSLYEGITGLNVINSDGFFDEDFMLTNPGNSPGGSFDPIAQSAECRFSRFMYALADGRLEGNIESAVDLLINSKCMVLYIYNTYYTPGLYFPASCPTPPCDPPIPWADYGCINPAGAPACAANVTLATCTADPSCAWDAAGSSCLELDYTTECTCIPGNSFPDNNCNGIDEDCSGVADDGFVPTPCGDGPCAGVDGCLNGTYVSCVPDPTAATNDINCDGVDDDCDGTADDDFSPTWCGIGGCRDSSTCTAGVEAACSPGTPSREICNLQDDSCNWLVDEGLDYDTDTFGCNPAHPSCDRMAHCRALTDSGSCTAGVGCAWFPAAGIVCSDYSTIPDCLGRPGCAWDAGGGTCDVATDDKRCIGDCANVTVAGDCVYPTVNGCEWIAGACVSDCGADVPGQWDCDDFNDNSFIGAPEICDYEDNNCNFLIDEGPGVLNDCGTCEPTCESTCYGGEDECISFNPTPGNSDSIDQNPCECDADCGKPCVCDVTVAVCDAGCSCDPDCACACDVTGSCDDGAMTITSSEVNVEFAWVSNDTNGTISKIDTSNGKEVGRYCATLSDSATDQGGAPRGLSNVCGACGGCNRPSRSAVDLSGNVFIANRAHSSGGYQASFTKLANIVLNDDCSVKEPGDCVDYNNNGSIETSCDVNLDGVISTNLADGEYLGENDECVLWTKAPNLWEDGITPDPKGDGVFIARAITIDADGDVWLGNERDDGMWELDPVTGLIKRWVHFNERPYGAVIDSNGILYISERCICGEIHSYNTTDQVVTNGVTTWAPYEIKLLPRQPGSQPQGNYGIAIDGRNRVWVGGWNNELVAARWDPATNTWDAISRSGSGDPAFEQWLGGTATMSAWFKTTQSGDNNAWSAPALMGVENNSGGNDIFWGFLDGSERIGIQAGDGNRARTTVSVDDGVWHHVAMTRNHTTGAIEIFLDGTSREADTGDIGLKTTPFFDIGRAFDIGGSHEEFGGSIDEVRISSSVRSADWIEASYLTTSDNFITYGAAETGGGSWWDAAWSHRVPLTFDNSASGSDLTSFPVMVAIDPAAISGFDYADADAAGADLRFIGAGGVELDFEVERWNPAAGPVSGDILIEAEDYDSRSSIDGTHNWNERTSRSGYNGSGYMQARPDNGTNCGGNVTTCGCEMTFNVTIPADGDYRPHFRINNSSSSDNSLNWGWDGVHRQELHTDRSGSWVWEYGDLRTLSAGAHVLNVWMREDDQRIDQVGVTTSTTPPTSNPPSDASIIWVRVPTITAGATTESITMYYGNAAAADSQNATGVWDADYEAVYHLAHNALESTDANLDGTLLNGVQNDDGPLGGALKFDGGNDYVQVFLPSTPLPGTGKGRGVTVDSAGIAWVAQHGTGGSRLTGFDVDTMEIANVNGQPMNFDISPSSRPIGVGIGYAGTVWTANQSSWNMTVLNPQNATMAHFPVGGPTYTYSDFTGNLLRTFTAPQGAYSEVIEGCMGNEVQEWVAIIWEGITPGTTQIGFRVRVADDPANLGAALWYPNPADPDELFFGSPIDITSVPAGTNQWIEVEAVLISDENGIRPTLSWFKVARDCMEL